jgi:hypothetical protein
LELIFYGDFPMLGFRIINGITCYYLALLVKNEEQEDLVEFDIADCTITKDNSEIGYQVIAYKLISSETGLAIYVAEMSPGNFMVHGNTEGIVSFVNSLSKIAQSKIMDDAKFIITKSTGYIFNKFFTI